MSKDNKPSKDSIAIWPAAIASQGKGKKLDVSKKYRLSDIPKITSVALKPVDITMGGSDDPPVFSWKPSWDKLLGCNHSAYIELFQPWDNGGQNLWAGVAKLLKTKGPPSISLLREEVKDGDERWVVRNGITGQMLEDQLGGYRQVGGCVASYLGLDVAWHGMPMVPATFHRSASYCWEFAVEEDATGGGKITSILATHVKEFLGADYVSAIRRQVFD
jgi:hypothetical protein